VPQTFITQNSQDVIQRRDTRRSNAGLALLRSSIRRTLSARSDSKSAVMRNPGTSVDQIERFYARNLPLSREISARVPQVKVTKRHTKRRDHLRPLHIGTSSPHIQLLAAAKSL
jgi:hypothetical protein